MPRELYVLAVLLRSSPLSSLCPFSSDLTLLKRGLVALGQCENDWSHLGIIWPL